MPGEIDTKSVVSMIVVIILLILIVLGCGGTFMSVRNIESHYEDVSKGKTFSRQFNRPALEITFNDNDIVRSVTGSNLDQEAVDNRTEHDTIFEEFEGLTVSKRRELFDLLYTNGFGGKRETYVFDNKEDRACFPEMQEIFEEIERIRTSSAATGSEPSYDDRAKQTIEEAVKSFIEAQGETVYKKVVDSNEEVKASVVANTAAIVTSQNAVVQAVTAAGNPIAPGTFPELMVKNVAEVVIPAAWALTADELQIIEDMKAYGTGEEALMVFNTSFSLGVKYLEDGDIVTRPGVFLKQALQAGLSYYGVSDSGGNTVLPASAYGKVVEILLARFFANR